MTSNDHTVSLEKLLLWPRRGFIFQTSEIYGGLANAYDYGPLGTDLLLKVKQLWWDFCSSPRRHGWFR